jgi:hypothetical protein
MGISGKSFRFYAEAINDVGAIRLSDRAFRLWINLRCCDIVYDGCLPSDPDLAWYCRLKPRQFAVRIDELLDNRFVERGPDQNLAVVPRNYESLRLPAAEWAILRSAVFERDNYTCTYCGVRGPRLECDHIFPLSRGGSNEVENLTTACSPCNRSKHAKLLSEWVQ